MKVKLDENLPRSLVSVLTEAGHDTDSVAEEGLTGANDQTVFASAQDAGRLLVTLDRGFGDIRRYAPGKLWFDDIGPVAVPTKASDLAEVGWEVTALLLGRTRSGWKILEMGNVYPG